MEDYDYNACRPVKSRKSISLAVKLEVINRIQGGEKSSDVARAMGLPPSTVRTINKDADRIRECSENASSLSSKVIKRKRSKIMERLEFELCQWIQLMTKRSMEVSIIMIQERALEIFHALQDQEPDDSPDKRGRFNASRGWFDRFRRRQNIHLLGFGYEKTKAGTTPGVGLRHCKEENADLVEDYDVQSSAVAVVKEKIDDNPILETAQEFLEFQMVVDDSDGEKFYQESEVEKMTNHKMNEARTSMIDIQIEPSMLNDPDKRSKVLHEVEEILQLSGLKKKYEGPFGETYLVILNNETYSVTCTLKTYPFGLITLTFEHTVDEASMSDPKLEEMRKLFVHKLHGRSETIPPIKRGSAVPVYFTSSDERILEYDFDKIVFEKDSQYQNVKILHSPTLGNVLILDDLQNLGDCDLSYTQNVMKHGIIDYAGKDVLILGGGDGGLLHELLKENPKCVTMVDNEVVVNACREHLRGCCGDSLDKLEGPNYKVIIDDCLVKLDEYKVSGRKFDIVINDLTDIPISTSPQGELWDFIKTILIKSFAVLKDNGSYLNHAIGEGCVDALKNYENVLSNFPDKLKFEKHVAFVPSFMEKWVFYEVKKV